MTQEQRNQLGVWLGLIGNSELYGGKLNKTQQETFNKIMFIWEKMPAETRQAGIDSIQGMINGFAVKEPALLAKAKNISTGVIGRMQKLFKWGSPSRTMIKDFGYVIEGATIGMDKEKGNLYKETEQIAQGVLDRFSFEQLSGRLQEAVNLQNGNISASLNNSMSRNMTANINLSGSVEMDRRKVGRLVAPSVQRTFREAGAYVN